MSSLHLKLNFKTTIADVLDTEAQAILSKKDYLSEQINECVNFIVNCTGRVIVTGIGKSGLIGKKIAATLSSTGTPSFFLHPAEGLHGDLGMVTKDDIVLAISNSGETEEVLKTIPSIKRIGAKIISLVGNINSTLADRSNLVLSYGIVEEACPLGLAPTTSTTLTLVIGDALAIALLKARNFKAENFALFHPGGTLGKKLLLTVEDIMLVNNRNPIAKETSKVKDIIFKMTEYGLGAINIVNENHELKGILTDGDIRRGLAKEKNILDEKVNALYNKKPITIQKHLLAAEALKIMEDSKVNVLPVIDNNQQPIGMIHIQDVVKMGI
ncbi:KpsF/GutQ family sugar-phosphate isomerase [Priestia flexa]|uniref:KpsF/GutQ family sugar-phosphate isomerase n=1 Tax=Priestia flexa TaxID=86664 RepID=UPI001F433715|nr:KpsF/GutQ family sugar-phosphate isomerase [Priestia flexa]UIR30980.1 KpsF/GutQ family sugar-phosphate isomerase [Priestia flexa]